MSDDQHISRKELAAITGEKLSERTIRRREQELGLRKCRVKFSRKPVLYWRRKALEMLITKEVLAAMPAFE